MSQINESAIKTPGVYINEIPSFPPSVAQVATAIPAFIGYTEFARAKGESVLNIPYKIESLTEYLSVFGGEDKLVSGDVSIQLDVANDFAVDTITYNQRYIMFDAIRQFYDNGGSRCYVVSVGLYGDEIVAGNEAATPVVNGLRLGVKAIEKYDEPTLILFPDAVMLEDPTDFYALQQMAIEQCAKLQDRFAVLDIKENILDQTWEECIQSFRDNIGINSLNYAAAYTPWIATTYDKSIDFEVLDGNITDNATPPVALNLSSLPVSTVYNDMVVTLQNNMSDTDTISNALAPLITADFTSLMDRYNSLRADVIGAPDAAALDTAVGDLFGFLDEIADALPDWNTTLLNPNLKTDLNNVAKNTANGLGTNVRTLIAIEKNAQVQADFGIAFTAATFDDYDNSGLSWINVPDVSLSDAANIPAKTPDYTGTDPEKAMAMLVDLDTVMKGINGFITRITTSAQTYTKVAQDNVYNNHPILSKVVSALIKNVSVIPPSGTMVGIYSKIDATRGVWKAPANVSINSVIGPSEIIDDLTQEDLNIDTVAGKSINAIRAFTGKGTLVWGARTLEGNSKEWRYVSVRRFFIMVEESSKKATAQFVFEPNDANTWVKVRAMLENYLTVLWRQGALAGAKPEHAFYVKVGLGQTMTAADILDGFMIVEIGMAAVRPAEFIILRFMHKMQES